MQLKVVLEKLLYPIEPLLIKVDCCDFPSISIVITSTITMTNFITTNVIEQWVEELMSLSLLRLHFLGG
jgi:hypothetical protein